MAPEVITTLEQVVVGWIILSCVVAALVVALIVGGRCRERGLPRTRSGLRAWIRGESEPDDAR